MKHTVDVVRWRHTYLLHIKCSYKDITYIYIYIYMTLAYSRRYGANIIYCGLILLFRRKRVYYCTQEDYSGDDLSAGKSICRTIWCCHFCLSERITASRREFLFFLNLFYFFFETRNKSRGFAPWLLFFVISFRAASRDLSTLLRVARDEICVRA